MVVALKPSHDYIYPCVSRPRNELRKGHRYTQQIAQLWRDRWVNIVLAYCRAPRSSEMEKDST